MTNEQITVMFLCLVIIMQGIAMLMIHRIPEFKEGEPLLPTIGIYRATSTKQ